MRKLHLESLESRQLLSVDPSSFIVHISGPVGPLPVGWRIEPAGQSGYTKLIHNLNNDDEVQITGMPHINGIDYIGPNPTIQSNLVPDDTFFSSLWGMQKIQAPEAWDIIHDTPNVVVASIDTGVNMSHPDLMKNIWTNPGEIADNGIDDDQNGFIDDVHGWDFRNEDNDPSDDNNHGTHVSGTIGAIGNNRLDVVGVSWNIQIMPLKFLSSMGGGTLADAIQAIDYAAMMGVPISNNSWSGSALPNDPGWAPVKTAIELAGQTANHLFVTSAGNNNRDNDISDIKNLPAAWDSDNIISVAASTEIDEKAVFSAFGKTTIDLFAPGTNIASTCIVRVCTFSGTSMSAPHVVGVAALLKGQHSEWGHKELKNQLLASVDKIEEFEELVVSGGRLNAFKSLSFPTQNLPPNATDDVYSINKNELLKIPAPGVLSNDTDPDGDILFASLATGPFRGLIDLSTDGAFSYLPQGNFVGIDEFTYKVSDGNLSDIATVTIEVKETNLPPDAVDDFFTTNQNEVLIIDPPGILENDSDPNDDSLSVSIVSNPLNGNLALDIDGGFTYTPNSTFLGTDTWTYQISDGTLTDEAQVTIEVRSPNQAPVGVPDFYVGQIILHGYFRTILSNDIDPERDSLSAVLVEGPEHGELLRFNSDGSFIYLANPGFRGVDTLLYKAKDDKGNESEPIEVTLFVFGRIPKFSFDLEVL